MRQPIVGQLYELPQGIIRVLNTILLLLFDFMMHAMVESNVFDFVYYIGKYIFRHKSGVSCWPITLLYATLSDATRRQGVYIIM
jgi:hypothetical protein